MPSAIQCFNVLIYWRVILLVWSFLESVEILLTSLEEYILTEHLPFFEISFLGIVNIYVDIKQ